KRTRTALSRAARAARLLHGTSVLLRSARASRAAPVDPAAAAVFLRSRLSPPRRAGPDEVSVALVWRAIFVLLRLARQSELLRAPVAATAGGAICPVHRRRSEAPRLASAASMPRRRSGSWAGRRRRALGVRRRAQCPDRNPGDRVLAAVGARRGACL